MKFDQYKFLRHQAKEKLFDMNLEEGITYTSESARQLDSLILAYIGDAVYSLYVREHVIACAMKVQVVHNLVTPIISAKGQAHSWEAIEEMLTEDELLVTKRARNSNVHVPKSATVQEYRRSTALEALFGYLYLTNQKERLQKMLQIALSSALEKL